MGYCPWHFFLPWFTIFLLSGMTSNKLLKPLSNNLADKLNIQKQVPEFDITAWKKELSSISWPQPTHTYESNKMARTAQVPLGAFLWVSCTNQSNTFERSKFMVILLLCSNSAHSSVIYKHLYFPSWSISTPHLLA